MFSTVTFVFRPVHLDLKSLRQRANCALCEESTNACRSANDFDPILLERYMKGLEVNQEVPYIPSL